MKDEQTSATIKPVDRELQKFLTSQGYMFIVQIPGRGVCAVMQFMFTFGLCYGIDSNGYKGRYCYPDLEKAILGLNDWAKQLREFGEVREDPRDGNWIKHK